ncbi:MAG: chloride channel protein [Planctomycetota bacterium]|nr:chloride channel protein [Planctomycetota bacterium]
MRATEGRFLYMPDLTAILSRLPRPTARWVRLFGLGALVGVVGGLAAYGLDQGLHFGAKHVVGRIQEVDPGGGQVFQFHWAVLLLPALGGLFSGLVCLAFRLKAGHGTDILCRAFHRNMGELPLRGPFVKAVASVGVISCGGSAGPEGPTAALGAAIGSTFGKLFGLTPRERRTLLVAGCGAGIGAIFRCPMGGALFAAGVLYREPEFESEAIVPSFVASVIGYSTFMSLVGFGTYPLLLPNADALTFATAIDLLPYAVLGPLCGAAAIFFSLCLSTVEKRVLPWSRLPLWIAPAVGGLATGGLACVLPQVMDGQYDFIRNIMSGKLWLGDSSVNWWFWAGIFGLVALLKSVATAFTVGSGASGGVLGPSLFIGGAVGAFVGAVCQALFPDTFDEQVRQALIPVGMAGVLAAAMRTPMAAIVMVTEMTGSYGLIVPLMLVCVSSYVVGRRWGLNHEQIRNEAESPAHAGDVVVNLLESLRVDQLMQRRWPMHAPPGATLPQLVEKIQPGTRPVFAIVDGDRLVGLVSVPDIHRIIEQPGMAAAVIASDIMSQRLETVAPDDDVYSALTVFKRGNHDVLPVVSRDRGGCWLGMLTREAVFDRVQRQITETQKLVFREHTGLAAIEQEGQLQQLVMGVTPMRRDMIQRLLVPLQALNRSLRDCDFRRQFGAQVIAIEQPDGTIQCPPDLDVPLQTDQRLLAIVWDRSESDLSESNK